MATYKGMNFGAPIGSVGSQGKPVTSGRLIRIKKYIGENTNPLQGGFWRTTWIEVGDPVPPDWGDDPLEGWGGGGGGGMGDGGGGLLHGGVRHPIAPYPPPPGDCGKFYKLKSIGAGSSDTTDTCTSTQKAAIAKAIKTIQSDPAVSNYMRLFGDGGLWSCITSRLCHITYDCRSHTQLDKMFAYYEKFHSDDPTVPEGQGVHGVVMLAPDFIAREDLLLGYILWGLIVLCGGSSLDAILITDTLLLSRGSGGWNPVVGKDFSDLLKRAVGEDDFDDWRTGKRRHVVIGNFGQAVRSSAVECRGNRLSCCIDGVPSRPGHTLNRLERGVRCREANRCLGGAAQDMAAMFRSGA